MAKTCESCKAIWAEKMQQVVQKESHKAVQIFTSFNDWEQIEINKKKRTST